MVFSDSQRKEKVRERDSHFELEFTPSESEVTAYRSHSLQQQGKDDAVLAQIAGAVKYRSIPS